MGQFARDDALWPSDSGRPRMGLADVHMHTTASDGLGTPRELVEYVQQATDLDVIAITDHDTIEGALRARDLTAGGSYRFELIVGEEVSTREGHLLGLFLERPVAPGQSIERSIELIHEQGGLAIVAHPFHRMFRFSVQRNVMDRLLRQPEVHPDGIETLNGSFAGIGANRVAMTLSRRLYRWAETGGSDAHTLTAIGCARTRFPGTTASELRAAVRARQTAPLGGLWAAREYMAYARHVVRTRAAASRALGEQARGAEHAGLARSAAARAQVHAQS
jgi:predicted metal-dependent phosphoesterase TrpH